MLKGKLKYIVLGIGVLVVSLGIMRYTPLAFANSNYTDNFRPRGHHRMIWDYDGEENWDEFREHHRRFRPGRGCMGYYYDDNELDEGTNK